MVSGTFCKYSMQEDPSFIIVPVPVPTPVPVPSPLNAPVPTIVIEDTNGDIVDLSDEIVPANPEPVSYLSYCVVS